MRQKTLEKKIKAGKIQPKSIVLTRSGTEILFIPAPNKDYVPYFNFRDGQGKYLGSLDPQWDRRELRQLQRWINKMLEKTYR